MKRKIIKQGQAFTCTLPVDWVRSNNLCAGHEVDFEHVDDNLIVSAEKQRKQDLICLNLKEATPLIERFIPTTNTKLHNKTCRKSIHKTATAQKNSIHAKKDNAPSIEQNKAERKKV